MIRNVFVGATFVGALVVSSATEMPYVQVGETANAEIQRGESVPLGTEYDCTNSCNDCQKACESKPAGSARSDCMRSCSATAAGCCAGYGKKPPSGMTCACQ